MTESGCRGGGPPELASLKQFWDPDFNEALFFLGMVRTYKINLCVYE